MGLVEKLKQRAKELDAAVKRGVTYNDYPFQAADDRELLERTVKHIAHLELNLALFRAARRPNPGKCYGR
jgi:hypothetical protein